MESLGKDHAYLNPSLLPSTAHEEYTVQDVIITRRLRDRELLQKRKAEAQEKDSVQEQEKSKRQKRGRGAGRGRGHRPVIQAEPKPEPKPEPHPEVLEEGEAEKELAELAPPVLEHQGKPPMMMIQELLSGTQQGAVREESTEGSLYGADEEDSLRPAEAEIPEALNICLENNQDNEYYTPVLF
ncbi:hemogen-like isoform X2 [Struthio camelus]|uniref:hemogen-like isoform X2 n=1 Tax=Struthio camelus TaxID=8801 RepID=UPI00051E5138|nr:PREDICTED: hemogen-like isoform X2 [Struthio camelus australis]